MKDIVIFISTFGFRCIKVSNSIAIEVGAANRNKFRYLLKDNTGINISKENEYYGELTGLYWIWKNYDFKDIKYIGFCHYNKKLSINQRKARKYLELNSESWVVSNSRRIPKHSDINEWKIFDEIIRVYYPEYYPSLIHLYNREGEGDKCNTANLFITSVSEFYKYCEFVFGVCDKLRTQIGDNDKIKFDKRYCAFLAERLLSVYLQKNEREYLEVPIMYSKRYLSIISNILTWLHVDRNSRIYLRIRKKLDKWISTSSYKRKDNNE